MPTETSQERLVVVLVVMFLGLVAVGGLAGLVFLIWIGSGAEQLLAVSSFAGPATGALAGILATTRTGVPPAVSQAQGYVKALDDVDSFKSEASVEVPEAPGKVAGSD